MNGATLARTAADRHDDAGLEQSRALCVHLLGHFRVRYAGVDVPAATWRLRKARQLVALLALAPAHRLHREQVMDTLWPDLDPEAAANNLHYTLHVARRSLSPEPGATGQPLRLQGGQVYLHAGEQVWTDARAFETAAMVARTGGEPADFATALDLYAGDLLPEDPYEDWAVERRQMLRDTYLELLLGLAGVLETRGELEPAAGALRRVIEADAAHEPAHAALMRLYASTGRRAQALRQYQQLRDALARELEVEPDPTTDALHADILAGRLAGPAGVAAMRVVARPQPDMATPSRPTHNLPAPLTSFIGRARDLAEIERALGAARLVTVTGPGGCGKTRLAIEAGRVGLAAFPDGVWFVDLTDISDAALVPQVLAAAVGVIERPGQPMTETVLHALADCRSLIVLDNCEHLLTDCARLAVRLLEGCPRVRLLATSREPLRVPGELTWPLEPLATPDAAAVPSPRCLGQVDAVRLFVERAGLSRPDFALTAKNAGAVARICRRLTGSPLAIELAASWTRMFSAEQVDAMLASDLRLILDDQRNDRDHQRGLRATVERSYILLTRSEQALFRRLAVFSGGCTLAAAMAVCCSDDEPTLPCRSAGGEHAVLAALAALVDKNLLRQDEAGSGEPRFTMPDTIRAYGLLQLEERGEAAALRERHARWYLALVESWRAALSDGDSRQWLDRLQRERDNFRAALGWAMTHAEGELGLRLATALYGFWYVRGSMSEGFAWLRRALEHAAGAPVGLRIQAAYMAGELARVLGNQRQATLLAQQCLAAARAVGDTAGTAQALFLLANIADSAGDHERAVALHEQALELYRAIGDRVRIAMVLNNLGDALLMGGELARAVPLLDEALALWRARGSTWGASIALLNLAEAARQAGDTAGASRLARESLRLARELDDHWGMADCFTALAEVAVGPQPERAARLLGAAEALRGDVGVTSFADSYAQTARVTLAARAALGAGPFVELKAEGRALPLERAALVALGEV